MPTTRNSKSGYFPRNRNDRRRLSRYRRKLYRRLSDEQRESRREYQREYQMRRRREAGIPARPLRLRVDKEEPMRLPVTQGFKDWVATAFEQYRFLGAEDNIGVSNKQIFTIMRGQLQTIDLDLAERLLIYANGPMPWEIWPGELGV